MSSLNKQEATPQESTTNVRKCPKCHGSGVIPRLDLERGRYETPCDRCQGQGSLSDQDDDD
jgi:DnaJ-class molecular chaperone